MLAIRPGVSALWAIAFWLIPPAGLLLMSSFLLPGDPAQAGWWSYPPISIQNLSVSSDRLLWNSFSQHFRLVG
ncbi:hypothetical protein DP113_11630 [Brasilonema octagenarum UFV-E1]|uniref:Uncharacterized protein n=2 Tax=Brasilonema TaxID=383614 RepID=A0A856MEC1_9CYAN|nr:MULTISPECIES: hypothetical protein [Brasilonema]NMF62777.1 hypothetical protein [Brasilonema octagenarum UFV-OR1]QDL08469.1 hypothetical protein DP114_11690 [Brasilonema sennae CENA114]QDL14825.1 hypothetical protein DP113_11630 [Brasilonema octagenarum UFV-E1]